MPFYRTHRCLIAWILFTVVLCNGLACSLGHGKMTDAPIGMEDVCAAQVGHAMSATKADHHFMHISAKTPEKNMNMPGDMNAQSGDCSFAGTLTLAILFFMTLGWLLRSRNPALKLPGISPYRLSRHLFPQLNPQAP